MRHSFLQKSLHQHIFNVAVIVLLSIPLVYPFFKSGFFPTHDGEWTVVRLSEMYREVKDGQIPPRYSTYLNFGHGYPLFNFAYPLPYYLGIVPVLLKFGFVNSIKSIFVLSVIFSGIFMYMASSALWKNKAAGVIASILWLYLPYRMVDLFVRGSLGESVAFIFFPLLLWLAIKVNEKPKSGLFHLLLVLSIAGLILSHNIMALLFLPIYIVFISALIWQGDKKNSMIFLQTLILGIGTAAYFWIPALGEKKNILLSHVPIADRSLHYVSLKQLVIPSWGYGVPGDSNAFTYQLGVTQIIFLIASFGVFMYWLLKSKNIFSSQKLFFSTFVLILIIQIQMLFSFSSSIWKHLPLLSEINYPWTLIGPIGFLIALMSGYYLTLKGSIRWTGIILAVLTVFLILPFAKPKEYVDREEGFYTTNDATTTSSKEYTPLWVKDMPVSRPEDYAEMLSGSGEISQGESRSNYISFTVQASKQSIVQVNTIFYPGWQAHINGVKTPIRYDNPGGLMHIGVPEGQSTVTVIFKETPLRFLSNMISIVSITLAIIFAVLSSQIYKIKIKKRK